MSGISPPTLPVITGNWDDYEWIVVMGGLMAFYMAWGIGANDVANSFATSVGSKTLKLWHAVIIAGCLEFLGAITLGGEVARTIAGNIAATGTFQEYPELFMYGMMCALASAGTWLLVATYWCLPVSTTHSIIGAICGFALVWNGVDGVQWNLRIKEFPYSRGMVPVICSWFVSPISAGIASSIIFFTNRICVLRRKNSTKLSFWVLPILVFLTIFINLQFVLYKGAQRELNWSSSHAAKIAAIVAGSCCFLSIVVGIPLMMRKHRKDIEAEKLAAEQAEAGKVPEEEKPPVAYKTWEIPEDAKLTYPLHIVMNFMYRVRNQFLRGFFYDVHTHAQDDEYTQSIHQAAEVFDPHTEQVYKYMQVFSSCCVAFSHGANDVANAIGPFAGIWFVYRNHRVTSSADAPKWIFVLGGAGIVVGLATYGYNIIVQLGVKMLKLTPSRGFSAELAAALTISVASRYGLPVSTTQIIVGAEIGVGLVESVRHGLNFWVLAKTFMGWVITIIIAAATSALIFAQGVYAPSIINLHDIREYRWIMGNTTNQLIDRMRVENARFRFTATNATTPFWNGAAPDFARMNGSIVNSTLVSRRTSLASLLNYRSSRTKAYVLPSSMAWYQNTTIQDYITWSAMMFGQSSKVAILNGTSAFVRPAAGGPLLG